MTAPQREFTLVRDFDAFRDLVYRVWTEPEHMSQWLLAHRRRPFRGPSRLWRDHDQRRGNRPAVITLTFDDRDGGTRLTLHLVGPAEFITDETGVEKGWSGCWTAWRCSWRGGSPAEHVDQQPDLGVEYGPRFGQRVGAVLTEHLEADRTDQSRPQQKALGDRGVIAGELELLTQSVEVRRQRLRRSNIGLT